MPLRFGQSRGFSLGSGGFVFGTGGTPTPTPTPAPGWTVQPSISGTPTVGQTLTGADGTISNGTVSARAWLRAGTPISGATGSTYLLDAADNGALITFRVTATGAGGSAQATSSAVGPVAPAPVPELWLGWGDSLGVGIDARDPAIDLNWPGANQLRWRAPVGISSNISPLDQAVAPTGVSYLSPYEYFMKQRIADIVQDQYFAAYNANGSSFGAPGWGVGNTLHEAFIVRANNAIATFKAAFPNGVIGGIIQFECSNDANSGSTPLVYEAALVAAIADMRARIFQNGVSGANIANSDYLIYGMLPEFLSTTNRTLYEQVLRRVAATTSRGKFYKMPEGISRGDNLHPSLAGSRLVGAAGATVVLDTTAPTITGVLASGSYSSYEGQKMLIELSANEYAYFTLSGADAANFEIVWISDGASGINLSRMRQYIRWAADGTPSVGTYNITLNAEDGSGNVTSLPVTFPVLAAYGTQVETLTATTVHQSSGAITSDARNRAIVPITLGAGMNMIVLSRNTGGATDTTGITFNGIQGIKDPSSGTTTQIYYLPSAVAQTGNLLVTPNSSTITSMGVQIVRLRGTVASPASVSIMQNASRTTPHLTGSLTCPASGIIVGGGNIAGIGAGTGGQTTLQLTGNNWTAYRTTDGALGYAGTNNGFSWLGAAAFAKA